MDKTNDTIAGMRFQKYKTNEVHIHDDSKGIKFISTVKLFKDDFKKAVKQLKSGDGAYVIDGSNDTSLFLLNDGSGLKAFIAESNSDVLKDIEKFANSL